MTASRCVCLRQSCCLMSLIDTLQALSNCTYDGHHSCTDSFFDMSGSLLGASRATLKHISQELWHCCAQVDSEVNVFFPLAHWVMADEGARLQHLYPLTGAQQNDRFLAILLASCDSSGGEP